MDSSFSKMVLSRHFNPMVQLYPTSFIDTVHPFHSWLALESATPRTILPSSPAIPMLDLQFSFVYNRIKSEIRDTIGKRGFDYRIGHHVTKVQHLFWRWITVNLVNQCLVLINGFSIAWMKGMKPFWSMGFLLFIFELHVGKVLVHCWESASPWYSVLPSLTFLLL